MAKQVRSAPADITALTATIALNGTVSGAVVLGGATVTGIQMPAAFTGTAMTFQVSADGVTYVALYDDTNTLKSITVAASRGYTLDPALFAGWPYMKVVSGTAEGAARAVTLLTRPV